jgi:Tfp pilus assembly protein PilF
MRGFEENGRVAWTCLGVGLALALLVALVYAPVRRHDFVGLDDNLYVAENPHVTGGLTPANVRWALAGTVSALWQPVTMLSHMLDCTLFGVNPGLHHLSSVFIHVLNVVLLFGVLRRMTGSLWRSALVAALFAVHPLNVDSVAWIAERKSVLSTTFWLLAIIAYVRYARRPSQARYAAVFGLCALGMMAKPIVVTLPATLLLLDYWPLGRLGHPFSLKKLWRAVLDKAPLLAIAAGLACATVWAQHQEGALRMSASFPLASRPAYVADNYVHYLSKLVWPFDLVVVYPVPHSDLPTRTLLVDLAVLGVLTVAAARSWRRSPHITFGWLWYLVTLLPVCGMAAAGIAIKADRFAYVPLMGLFVAGVWDLGALAARSRVRKVAAVLAALAAVGALAVIARAQVGVWRNNETLYRHALAATENNFMMHVNLGVALEEEGRPDEAMAHYEEALRINPRCANAHYQIGKAAGMRGDIEAAARHLEQALSLGLRVPPVYYNLSVAWRRQGNIAGAIDCLQQVLKLQPENEQARRELEGLHSAPAGPGGW